MDDAELAARERATQHAFFAGVVGRSGRAVAPAPGVVAVVVPSVPHRSLPNSVLYADPAVLDDAVLDELGAVYADAGVHAWTVWVRPGDDALARRLAARGHALDGQPMLMAAPLAEIDLRPRAGLDLDPDPGWRTLAAVNDRAYGTPGDLERVLGGLGAVDGCALWVAREAGEPVAALAVHLHEGDAGVEFVAVVPEARGRGLAAELMRHALTAAAQAGATTTSLEASAMGEPVYRRLGYRALGRFGMWERRTPAPA
ncbi:MAG: GNAT family N-acetyltransferase [Solirubrobacteraceae bacterium]|nr:GNAT family N-acetyltransferase [Solirubrobacteraceae bacterium]